MSVEYWIRTSTDGVQRGLMRVTRTEVALTGEYVNRAGEWETDNSRIAQLSGIGGDVEWEKVTPAEAQAFLDHFNLSIPL